MGQNSDLHPKGTKIAKIETAARSFQTIKMSQPIVLVTGCTDGTIGSALCLSFAKRGAKVYATARKLSSMAGLEGVEKLTLDVTDPESIKACVAEVIKREGRVDVLINNVIWENEDERREILTRLSRLAARRCLVLFWKCR